MHLADAFGLWRVQGVQLVLVLRPLLVYALGALHPGVQLRADIVGQTDHLASRLAQQPAQDRALPLEHAAQPLELLGVGVAPGAPAQHPAFALVRLLALDADTLDQPGNLVGGDFQQPAVGGVGDGLALHGGVEDDTLELGLLDGTHGHCRFAGGLQQLFYARFTQHATEAAYLGCVAGQARLEVDLAAEELEAHVLGPALDQGLVALVVGAVQAQQSHHQADQQARPSRIADTTAGGRQRRAEQVRAFDHPALAVAMRKHRRQGGLDVCPRHARGQHRQRVTQVDHLVEPGAEEVVGGHWQRSSISQELTAIGFIPGRNRPRKSPESRSMTKG